MTVKKKIQQKGATVPRKRIIADIPEVTYRALKVYSAQTDMEMREIIDAALKLYFEQKGGKEQ